MVGDPTVAELAHHRWCAPRSEDLGAGVLLRLPHGRGLWDGPADLRGHEVRLRVVDRFAHVHARPPVQDADRLLLRLAQHGPPHGFGALFGHGSWKDKFMRR